MLHDWKLAFIPEQMHLQRRRSPLGAYRHAAAHLGCCTCMHHIDFISSLTSCYQVQNKAMLENPPVSTHVSEAHRIRPPTATAAARPLSILGAQAALAPAPSAATAPFTAPTLHELL